MITEFGKLLRIIRINSGDSAKDMAEKLNISPSYLSTIENGKRNIPVDMEELLIRVYNLSDKDKEKLRAAMASSAERVKVDLTDLAEKKKRAIFALINEDLDDDVVERVYKIVVKKEDR